MAQLIDTSIDGTLSVSENIILNNAETSIQGINPNDGVVKNLIGMSAYGNTVIGYGNYADGTGDTNIYGDKINFYTNGDTITSGDVPFGMHALSVGCSSQLSLSTSSKKITCGTVYSNSLAVTSGVLEASGGGIKVLRKGRYLVSGVIYGSEMTVGNALCGAIYIGTSATAGSFAQTADRTYTSAVIPPRVLSVNANVELYLYAYNVNSATGIVGANNNTLLTVVALD